MLLQDTGFMEILSKSSKPVAVVGRRRELLFRSFFKAGLDTV